LEFEAVEEPGFSPAQPRAIRAGLAAATGAKALFHRRPFGTAEALPFRLGTAEAVPFHRSDFKLTHYRNSVNSVLPW